MDGLLALDNQSNQPSPPSPTQKLAMRLGVTGVLWPFDHVHVHQVSEDLVLVLVVNGEKHVCLEDRSGMFPSDQLVTQLRLLSQPKV